MITGFLIYYLVGFFVLLTLHRRYSDVTAFDLLMIFCATWAWPLASLSILHCNGDDLTIFKQKVRK